MRLRRLAGNGLTLRLRSRIQFFEVSRKLFPQVRASFGRWPRRLAGSKAAFAIPAKTISMRGPNWMPLDCRLAVVEPLCVNHQLESLSAFSLPIRLSASYSTD